MKNFIVIGVLLFLSLGAMAQIDSDLGQKLKSKIKKGDYIILELRLNKEDEFRTMEGGKSSLARIAVYSGKNLGEELVVKGFEGLNSLVTVLNDLKHAGFKLVEVYPVKGESLLLTHYIMERKK
ncbi:MAG: hypothetical protein ACPGSO_01440 [Vicingaceae bacterium]